MDISVGIAGGKYSYRVGAIIIRSNCILMAWNSGSPTYYTVGGRVKFGESAHEAVLREVREETGVHLEIDRLAFIHENFFMADQTKEPFHELCLFFLMKSNDQLAQMNFEAFQEVYGEVSLHWLPIGQLPQMGVYPEFFKMELTRLPAEVKHIVSRPDKLDP